jgi:hypothetical protein
MAPFILPVAAELKPSVTGSLDLTRPKDGVEVCLQSQARVGFCKLETGGIAGLHAANRSEGFLRIHGLEKIAGLAAPFEQLLPP